MAQVRTLEDFLRQRMVVDRHGPVQITMRDDGLFEASVVERDGETTAAINADPATALWDVLVPSTMRRTLASGREVVVEGTVYGLPEEITTYDDLDDLLG